MNRMYSPDKVMSAQNWPHDANLYRSVLALMKGAANIVDNVFRVVSLPLEPSSGETVLPIQTSNDQAVVLIADHGRNVVFKIADDPITDLTIDEYDKRRIRQRTHSLLFGASRLCEQATIFGNDPYVSYVVGHLNKTPARSLGHPVTDWQSQLMEHVIEKYKPEPQDHWLAHIVTSRLLQRPILQSLRQHG